MSRSHLAFDLDDVILDFVGGLRIAIKKEFGVEIDENKITDFDLSGFLNPIIGRSWWAWLRERDWLWPNFPAVDGAIGGLDILRREGYYIEIVTSKPKWAEYATWKWLGKWRPPVQRVTIVGSDDRKVDFTDAEILVDDKAENVQGFLDEGRKAIMLARPHNKFVKIFHTPGQFAYAHNWSEVLEHIRSMTDAPS